MLDRLMHFVEKVHDPKEISGLFREVRIDAKTTLVNEGDIIKSIFFVKHGCLRLWFNSHGRDITYQFFVENQVVSGFLENEKSPFTLESIEPSTVAVINSVDFETLLNKVPGLKDEFLGYITQRLACYSRLFLSRIRDSPAQRYESLLTDYPDIVQRVPQHYIATFLGITPVSLSRIRNKRVRG